jgi:hypothetical protein
MERIRRTKHRIRRNKRTSQAWDEFIQYRTENEGPIEMKELSLGILSMIILGFFAADFYHSAAELVRLVFL